MPNPPTWEKLRPGVSLTLDKCWGQRQIKRTDVEARVLSGLKDNLLHPDLIQEFIAEFQRESHKERLAALSDQAETKRQLAKVTTEIDNIVSAITQGLFHPSMKAKMDALEAERAKLEAKLAALPQQEPIAFHPGLAEIYARKVRDLVSVLNDEETRTEAAEVLRGLIDKVILRPDPDASNGHVIEVFGELGSILSLCAGDGTNAKAHAGGVGVMQVTMVAGAGCVEAPTIAMTA